MSGSAITVITNDQPSGGVGSAALAAVQHLILLQDNACLTSGAIADATTVADIKSTATIAYRIDGAILSKGATDNLWALTGTTLTAGQVNKWLLCLDSSGTASVVEGVASTTADGVSFATVTGSDGHVYPAPGPSLCVAGVVQVTCNSSTFVPGTTSLAAATITVVYRNGYEALMTGAPFPAVIGQ